jgi:hypothetical protein
LFVSEKVTGVLTPLTDAETLYAVALAMPFAVAVTEHVPSAAVEQVGAERVALAPVPGAVNATVAPETVFEYASTTFTLRAVAKAVPIAALWTPPAKDVMDDAPVALTAMPPLVALGLPLESFTVRVWDPAV